MDKPYRRLRKPVTRKKQKPQHSASAWFYVRMAICAAIFLSFVAIRLYGGEILEWTDHEVHSFLGGSGQIDEVYENAKDAVNRFCDRFLGQAEHD